MKKILLCIIAAMLVITGCQKKEDKKEKEPNEVGGWTVSTSTKYKSGIEETAKKAFEKATEDYDGMDLELVGLLGTQVVSGTNYMFIAKGTPITQNPVTNWKIVVVYEDLDGNAEIKNVEDFDFTKYTNNDIQFDSTESEGSWNVTSKEIEVEIDKDVEEKYESAVAKNTGSEFSKIAYLGSQVVSGTNYAMLDLVTTNDSKNYVAVITIYSDLDNNNEIKSIAYVDLKKFNN